MLAGCSGDGMLKTKGRVVKGGAPFALKEGEDLGVFFYPLRGDGTLGTTGDVVWNAIKEADCGQGVVVLADLGSSILTVRHLLEDGRANGHVRLVDAPFVEGAIAAAVMSSAGQDLDEIPTPRQQRRQSI